MSYFGIPIRNGLPIGLGSVAPLASGGGSPFSPLSLFSGGAPGAWYDPSDFSTLFQDSAGTTPVTAVEQPVGRILDKSGNGNHAFQSTSASRPVLSARYNLLTKTEQFDDAVWTKANATASGQRITANAGTFSVYAVQNSSNTPATSLTFSAIFPPISGRYRYVWLGDRGVTPIASATFDLQAVSVIGQDASVVATATTLSDGSVVCSITYPRTTAGISGMNIALAGSSYTSDRPSLTWAGGEFVDVKASFVPANQSTLPYQRVNTATDYATTGFLPYLKFDGVDDSLSTNSISFTSTDKMSVFAGVRKLSDATGAVIAELSPNANTGGWYLYPGNYASANGSFYTFLGRGSASENSNQAVQATPYAAPTTNVLAATGNISGDLNTLRVNTVAGTNATGDQGTGNYGNYPLYIGRRNNSSLPFNGQMYSMIIVGKAVTAGELSSTETYVNQKTGAY